METNSADEQDLAKALDGVDSVVASLNTPVQPATASGLSFEETTTPGSEPVVLPGSPVAPASDTTNDTPAITGVMAHPRLDLDSDKPSDDSISAAPAPAADSALEDIKKDALVELRPLVDKLTVGPEEKFDTYLLLIRSTDDTALIGPAHEAAKAIPDETRRAEALLDIIKEIDYLSGQKKTD